METSDTRDQTNLMAIFKYVKENEILFYCDLVHYCNEHNDDWFDLIICKYAYAVVEFFDSLTKHRCCVTIDDVPVRDEMLVQYVNKFHTKGECMKQNSNLHKAKDAKKDEFYTQLTDIEKEMKHYKQHFCGKVVFCNCDDPMWSEFWRYFHLNFSELGLKKLIATHYDMHNPTYKLEYIGGNDNNVEAGVLTCLIQNGDFRSDECIVLLKEADIVVTNPPFSLFREYVAQLIEHEKKFIIIGNVNALTYKEFFPLIKDNKVWIGLSIHSGDREFRVPESYPLTAASARIDSDGNKYIRVKGVRWFTNLDYADRHKFLDLWKKYTPEEYPHYDNYDAINVNKTSDIPYDYDDVMGVPITFLDKFNPDQFEIVGNEYDLNILKGRGYIAGKRMYSRIFIIKRKEGSNV